MSHYWETHRYAWCFHPMWIHRHKNRWQLHQQKVEFLVVHRSHCHLWWSELDTHQLKWRMISQCCHHNEEIFTSYNGWGCYYINYSFSWNHMFVQQETTCKDLCCWVLYPCYSVFLLTPTAIVNSREPNIWPTMYHWWGLLHGSRNVWLATYYNCCWCEWKTWNNNKRLMWQNDLLLTPQL